jgi:hypothetical protein
MDTIESGFPEEADHGEGNSGSKRKRYRIPGFTWIGFGAPESITNRV